MTTTEATSDDAPRAPHHWEADVVLRDGRTALIRPVRPEDADKLVEFYARVSDQSKYYRFFTPMPTLSARDVKRFTQVDHVDRVALVTLVADQMIAIGRWDLVDEKTRIAEVAFLVEDKHQGRGVAQLLLEHLAQAGRERGVEKFVAEVLPDNQPMIHMFREAGYKVAGGFEDGVMRLEFPIDPTDTALDVMEHREHRAEAASIERFFKARSVAIIGASRRETTVGQVLVRNLVLGGFTGRVYVVNNSSDAVAGMPAYDSVADIPDPVDIAIVAVPADAVKDVVIDCAAKGVHGLVVISSGFAETGERGRRRQRQLVRMARSYGLRLIGPNCLGIINTDSDHQLNASLSPLMPPRGRAGFFCQSGALGSAILEKVYGRGLGLSTFVSAGNRADVSGNDLLQFWEKDETTEVVLLYLESIGNPRKFSRLAHRVSRVKPVIAVRSGRATKKVPAGHAVRSIVAPSEAVDAMFHQAGVIQVDTIDEMFDVAQLVAHQPLPRGPRVAVVGNSDALGMLAADAAAALGLIVTKSVAMGPDATAEDFEAALDNAIDDSDVDSVVVVYVPPVNVSGEAVADVLAAVGEQSEKPLVSSFLGTEGLPELLRVPDVAGSEAGRGSVPSYPAVEPAVRALACVVGYADWLRAEEGVEHRPDAEDVDVKAARRVTNRVLRESPKGRDLTFDELHELLTAYGIDLWSTAAVGSMDAAVAAGAELGWDVVLKATAEHLRQRPDLAHVWRNIDNEAEMRDAWASLTRIITNPEQAGFVVQKNAPPGVPLALGSIEDPSFGPVVSFSIAGALTELLLDRSFRIPPIGRRNAEEMIREIRSAPMLFGYRGAEPVDTEKVVDLLLRLAQLKNDLPQLSVVELPLVLAGAEDTYVLAARARVQPVADVRSDWFARRLNMMAGDNTLG